MSMNMLNWAPTSQKFLVIGETGTGKTRFAGTFPKPYVFSFDGGVDPLAGKDIEYDLYVEDNRRNPKAYMRFLEDWYKVGQDPRFETLVLDNITNLSKYIMDDLIALNDLVDKNLGNGVWDMYRSLKNKMHDVLTGSITKNKHVVATAFPEWETDKNSGEMKVFPATEGRIRQEMAGWFGEVYYTWVDKYKDGSLRYRLKTKADGKYMAKSRLDTVIQERGGPGLPEYIEPDFAYIMSQIPQPKSK